MCLNRPAVFQARPVVQSSFLAMALLPAVESATIRRGTENIRAAFDEFLIGDNWKLSPGVMRMYDMQPASFAHVEAFMTAGEIERDAQRKRLRAAGIGAHLCTAVAMPGGELATFVFQRWIKDGLYDQSSIKWLDRLRPHFARAGFVAARLGMERAEATTSALKMMGVPAAVLAASGHVLTANSLLEALPSVFLSVAFGRMAIADATANLLFQQAIEAARTNVEPLVRSIPIPARDAREAIIVHLLPLRRAAHEIFSGADILVATTAVSASNLVPSPTILTGLFDLTPAEARVATALASGRSLKETAIQGGITVKTARTYLDRIFLKTGTHQQSQLVALLKSVQPPFPPG